MQQLLVSIVIPFKNTEAFLAECLQSVINQEYETWEVWAVNDHSEDLSRQIAMDFAQKDARINILDNTGTGIIEALRLAYSNSKGRLITRMDSDDIMTPDKLGVMVDSLLKHGKGHLAVGQVNYFSERGISNGYRRYEKWINGLTETGRNYSEIYKECVIPSPCWMVYREDFEACGAFEPDRYPEDYDLTFRFRQQGLTCIPCDKVLHLWRDYDTRTSRTSEHYAQNYFLDIKLHYFLEQDYNPQRPLAVWGAGKKGKSIAKGLIDQKVGFEWLCDNPNKIGKSIYGIEMKHFTQLDTMKNVQSIITVANEMAQSQIRNYLSRANHKEMEDYLFFC